MTEKNRELKPKSGFNWMQVSWSGPTETEPDACCYCDRKMEVEQNCLMLTSEQGWLAKFCDSCMREWFGVRI